jgi:glyceraldehyde-3-phosphate dehydrogenase/erythrose-4-phosphate dehydrogenase
MAELRRELGLKIGIIGVGRIGHLLATFLLRYGDVYPDELILVSIKGYNNLDSYCSFIEQIFFERLKIINWFFF